MPSARAPPKSTRHAWVHPHPASVSLTVRNRKFVAYSTDCALPHCFPPGAEAWLAPMPTLTIDGVTLSYRDHGRGMPVMLFHGFPLTGESFRPQIEALSSKYRLIVPDHRGFGESGGA